MTLLDRRQFLAGPGLVGAFVAGAFAQAPPRSRHDLVATQEGELPIILSAPHGGAAGIPGVPERKGEGLPKGGSGFVTTRDTGTEHLAYETAAAIAAKTGKKPYYVVAKGHRKYLDPNRPPDIAYQNPNAKPVYDAYHRTLADYCRAVKAAHGRGLLLDLHGQGAARDTVFRGTKDGRTVALLVQRFGPKAHDGPDSLFGLMAAKGWKAYPADGGKENPAYSGGYIVQTYGSHGTYGIDAVQLEFGADFRARDKIKATAAALAEAIDAYAKKYLCTTCSG
jgi:N-formylglutamate amidohydrolase